MLALVSQEVLFGTTHTSIEEISKVKELLHEFQNVIPKELPNELLTWNNIDHAIDLVSSSQLLNLPQYRMNPMEQAKLSRQVEKLLKRDLFKKFKSFPIPTFLHLKRIEHREYVLLTMLSRE